MFFTGVDRNRGNKIGSKDFWNKFLHIFKLCGNSELGLVLSVSAEI